jgi:hypothetical protein
VDKLHHYPLTSCVALEKWGYYTGVTDLVVRLMSHQNGETWGIQHPARLSDFPES